MPDLKPYRTKAQKAEAPRTARKDKDGAWRSNAPFFIHGLPGEWIWDATYDELIECRIVCRGA
jgi:hypothetical protein